MKRIIVPLKGAAYGTSFNDISQQLEEITFHRIDIIPWQQFAYRPYVQFTIAYGSDSIFLKYKVNEKFVRAVYSMRNIFYKNWLRFLRKTWS
jgi:hypothetical protein